MNLILIGAYPYTTAPSPIFRQVEFQYLDKDGRSWDTGGDAPAPAEGENLGEWAQRCCATMPVSGSEPGGVVEATLIVNLDGKRETVCLARG